MARPVISPLNIQATAPETFSVLQQRMRVAEEQTQSLISDLQALGMNCQGMEFDCHKSASLLRPISPVKVRSAFVGDNDTLWRNCENLVNRMCRMESVMQTLKLGVFRLHTEMKLNPKQSAEIEQRLNEVEEEHARELRSAQLEVMRLHQQLNSEIEEREREEEAKERLSAALEIATATKTDVAIAAEKMKASKVRLKQRVKELQEKLSQEAALRALLEEDQANMLHRVEDMKQVVEDERMHVKELQQSWQIMCKEGQELKSRLEAEELRSQQLENENMKLHSDLEGKDLLIKQLQEESQMSQRSRDAEQAELTKVRTDLETLQGAAEKVQCLNQKLEAECSALTATVQKLSTEKVHLLTQQQQELKAAQETMEQKLQEKQLILSATQASLTAELQNLQSLGTQRERELEALRAEHTECQRKAMHVEQKFAVQKEVQESTITRLRGDLDCALRDRAALENEKSELQEEMVKIQGNFQEIIQNLEVEVAEKKLELASVQSALLAQEQENKRLMECVALLEQEQHSRRQVEMLLNELMESKNKLAYEKGKLQSTVEQLKAELQSFGDANTENSQLRKLNTALETKYTQANAELGSCRIRLQRAEARLQQAQSVLLRKEEDFTLAIKARDETLKEETRLRGQLEVAEEREEQNMSAMQQQLSEVREERNRMSSMLENVVTSHTQLQQDLEKLQTELGHRDSNIAALLKERDHCQKQIKTLEGELSEYQAKLQSIESQKHAQIAPLHRAMEVAHEDNKTLAHALEQALQKSSSLQIRLNELEKDLKRKEFQEQQMEILRAQAEEDIHIQQQQYEERITTLKKQHLEECKEAKRAARRDMAELKKVLDCATAKSAELSRTNRELRNSKSEHEKTVLDQKNLIHSLRTQLKTRLESKAAHRETDRVQLLEAELKHMKQVKAEFEKSNKEQSKLIEEFMAEVESLRRAIKASSQNAEGTALCSQLETETQLRKKLEYKCKGLQQRVQELQEEKNLIEEKLRKASVESEQISRNLEEAHSWFQSQFEELQLENQEKRQQDINQSPLKSTLVDSRGNNMENLQRLPYSAVSHFETKEKLKLISRNYQSKEANSNPTRTECDMPS